MIAKFDSLNIKTVMDADHSDSSINHYEKSVHRLLQRLIPANCYDDSEAFLQIMDSLPIIKWSELKKAPSVLSIGLVCKHRLNATNFFYDMISRWLIPQKRLNVDLFFAGDFRLEENAKDTFTVAELVLCLNNNADVDEIRRNMRTIETELRLGVVSSYHANRITEFKGLSNDGKTAMIQEKIGSLMQSRSKDYDQSIFSQMQKFLVTCREEFKKVRDYHHISRIISILHLIRKLLKQKIDSFPNKRHVIVKFLKTQIKSSSKKRSVVGVMVGLNYLREHEVFEENHLLKAIKHYLPNVRAVENSFFLDRNRDNTVQTLYLEIENEDGTEISFDDIRSLRRSLPEHLKGHIEYLTHPIFMPRNEEEVVRNIMTLSRQLKYVHDIPQMIISFDEQTSSELCFTVILLRVLKPRSASVQEIFNHSNSALKFIPDRVRRVGILRRKYYKEATVFRVLLPHGSYLRADHSVNLYKARQKVVSELNRVFGEIRDYNGGMIHKQNELFLSLKASLGPTGMQHDALLEKFFYSITPVEMRSVLDPEPLKNLFYMLINAIKRNLTFNRKNNDWLFKQEAKRLYAVVPIDDSIYKKSILEAIEKMQLHSFQLVSFYLQEHDTPFLGYILISEDIVEQKRFLETLQSAIEIV